ncbi:hypothetical protein BB561_004160 [Smittium simulii]|uniref:DNL-type domain-containing protein n=1 Tax=Smittium simulii TaxID=133385 RepID=A0A2T9YHP1_9FUNG|nr:hypothetical protein BB561_004160 [Smittium simulii]
MLLQRSVKTFNKSYFFKYATNFSYQTYRAIHQNQTLANKRVTGFKFSDSITRHNHSFKNSPVALIRHIHTTNSLLSESIGNEKNLATTNTLEQKKTNFNNIKVNQQQTSKCDLNSTENVEKNLSLETQKHHAECNHSSENSANNDTPSEDNASVQNNNSGRYLVGFTCKVCQHRQYKTVSKKAYTSGVVLIKCDKCQNRHLFADHLGWFRDNRLTIEDIMRENGEKVKTQIDQGLLDYFGTDNKQEILKIVNSQKYPNHKISDQSEPQNPNSTKK